MNIPIHSLLPAQRSGYELHPERGFWSVIIASAGDNRCKNSSFESGTTFWEADSPLSTATIATSTAYARFGANSLLVTPEANGATNGCHYEDFTVDADTVYSAQIHFRSVTVGLNYRLYLYHLDDGVEIGSTPFVSTGAWQAVEVEGYAVNDGTGYLYVTAVDPIPSGNATRFYIDGVTIKEGVWDNDTYFDGDTRGFVEFPDEPPYLWAGQRHVSTSLRSRLTRSTGKLRPLLDLGLRVTAYTGAGLAPQQVAALDYALLPGAVFQGVRPTTRLIALTGKMYGSKFSDLSAWRRALQDAFKQMYPNQPLVLRYHPYDECGDLREDERDLHCVYLSGLEGMTDNLYAEGVTIQLAAHQPYFVSPYDSYAALDPYATGTYNHVAQRNASGSWSNLAGGFNDGAIIYDVIRGADGKDYFTGDFDEAGGVACQGFIRFNHYTGEFENVGDLGGSGAFAPIGHTLAVGPTGNAGTFSGKVFVGGEFETAGTIARPRNLSATALIPGTLAPATYSYRVTATNAAGETIASEFESITLLVGQGSVLLTWDAVSGATGYKVYGRSGGGGLLATLGGVTSWTDDGSVVPGASPPVTNTATLTVNRVAAYNIETGGWEAVGDGFDDTVLKLHYGPNRTLYSAGEYLTNFAGTTDLNYVAYLGNNGANWLDLDGGLNGITRAIESDFQYIYFGGSADETDGGLTINRMARWEWGATVPAWSVMGGDTVGVNNHVHHLLKNRQGWIIGLGEFTQAGDTPVAFIFAWNGTTYLALGDGLESAITSTGNGGDLLLAQDGSIVVLGSRPAGIETEDPWGIWTGTTWLPGDSSLPGNPISGLTPPGGALIITTNDHGTGGHGGVVTVTNEGSAPAPPRIHIHAGYPTGGPLYEVRNWTTKQAIYFKNLELEPSETIDIDFDPTGPKFTSAYRGDLTPYIIGRRSMELIPGENNIGVYLDNTTASAQVYWRNRYESVD